MTRWINGASRDILRAAFAEYFGVSEAHCDVLVVLYGRPTEWTHVRRLQVLIDSHRPPNRQALYERIRVLREVMDAESIESGGQLDDIGYRLSEVGFRECRAAMRATASALLRAEPSEEALEAIEDHGSLALPPPRKAIR